LIRSGEQGDLKQIRNVYNRRKGPEILSLEPNESAVIGEHVVDDKDRSKKKFLKEYLELDPAITITLPVVVKSSRPDQILALPTMGIYFQQSLNVEWKHCSYKAGTAGLNEDLNEG